MCRSSDIIIAAWEDQAGPYVHRCGLLPLWKRPNVEAQLLPELDLLLCSCETGATEMTYATEVVQRYRQALHHLWNMHFWAPEPFRDYASVRQFDRVKLPLFLSLVVDRLGSDLEDPKQIFGDAFKVVPPVAQTHGSIPSLMIEARESKGAWKVMDGPFRADEIKLSLLDFFDWQLLDWRDFRYYLVRVNEFQGDPSLIGCRGLVEVGYADVLWEPPGILGLPVRPSKGESRGE